MRKSDAQQLPTRNDKRFAGDGVQVWHFALQVIIRGAGREFQKLVTQFGLNLRILCELPDSIAECLRGRFRASHAVFY